MSKSQIVILTTQEGSLAHQWWPMCQRFFTSFRMTLRITMSKYYNNIVKKAILAAMVWVFLLSGASANAVTPNDPNYAVQASMWNQINAPEAWDYTVGSKRIVVAMIDTGMDTWHEDLRDNLWVNGEEISGNGIDDDHNGYVDDINGWNFVEDNNDVRTSVSDVADDKEAVRHGTLVGGQAGARGDNGLDGTGLSWRVSLMPLRAIRSDGKGSFRAVTRAVEYAMDNGADVISMSFIGEVPETSLLQLLRKAYEKGIVIVVAAGNYDSVDTGVGNLDSKPLYPVCFDKENGDTENWILSVGSVDSNDVLSVFSNYGKCLDIMAPGEYIYNAERYAPEHGYPNQFGGPWFGTSFATPLVAGSVALIKSIHPEWSPKKIISTLLATADPIDSKNPGREGQLGRGRINIGQAVSLAYGTPVAKAKGSIYFARKSVLWKYNLGGGRPSSVRSLSGVPIAIEAIAHYNTEQVAALVNRNGKYFLDVYRDDGSPVSEFAIPKSAMFGKSIIKFSRGIFSVVSSQYNKATKKTKIVTFNTRSRKATAQTVAGTAEVLASEYKLPTAAGKHWFLKVITMADRNLFLPYTSEGGSFVAYDRDRLPVLTVKVPSLK